MIGFLRPYVRAHTFVRLSPIGNVEYILFIYLLFIFIYLYFIYLYTILYTIYYYTIITYYYYRPRTATTQSLCQNTA